jgi:hypothetical protein
MLMMRRTLSIARAHASLATLAALAALAALAGCQSNGVPTGAQVATGQLGNGGFAFDCDDSVACDRYTNAAKSFPDAIALSSTFTIRYVPKSGGSSTGVTVGAVGETFIAPGVNGLTALHTGYGTIVARNASGAVVEFASVPIYKPESLVIYDAAYTGTSPVPITSVTLHVGEVRNLRALARAHTFDLAGTLQYEWTSPSDGVLTLNQEATGKVTLSGATVGTTHLTVAGGTFEQDLSVQVTP